MLFLNVASLSSHFLLLTLLTNGNARDIRSNLFSYYAKTEGINSFQKSVMWGNRHSFPCSFNYTVNWYSRAFSFLWNSSSPTSSQLSAHFPVPRAEITTFQQPLGRWHLERQHRIHVYKQFGISACNCTFIICSVGITSDDSQRKRNSFWWRFYAPQ